MTDLNDVEQIRLLEKQRYRAMQDGCSSQLLTLCHPQLAYTHSDGSRDTLDSYISKLNSRHYIYHDIEHPVEDIVVVRSEEHTSELQSRGHLVCRLLLEKKKYNQ